MSDHERDAPAPDGRVRSSDVPRRTSVEEFSSGGECLVYHPLRDEASALNRTATEVWVLCDGCLTVRAIAGALGSRYRVSTDDLIDDVKRVLAVLRTRGLVDLLDDGRGDAP